MYLGINAFFHDAGAAIVDKNGRIIAAAQEERFTRKKREARFPIESIKYCLKEVGLSINELAGISFSWDPKLLLLQRLIWSDILTFQASSAVIRDNLRKVKQVRSVQGLLSKEFGLKIGKIPFRYFRHHLCHAASAYFASPFSHAAFLTIDGRGELESMTWGRCDNNVIKGMGQNYFPHSIGKVYSATSRLLGFEGAEKDGTVMALAAYGQAHYLDLFRNILRLSNSPRSLKVTLDQSYFDLTSIASVSLPSEKLETALGIKRRAFDEPITAVHQDIAASLQKRTEEIIIELLDRLYLVTGESNLVLAGGVALNSVLNGKIERISHFKNVFIQPAASDAGLCLGAAYLSARADNGGFRFAKPMLSAALGPSFDDSEIKLALAEAGVSYEEISNLAQETAKLISEGKVVAWFQGRMEFGPRALGQRSLFGDPRRPEMLDLLNKTKKREKFRPFAISILEDSASEVLESITDSPFMLLVDRVRENWKKKIPSAQHVDGSVRVQTLKRGRDGIFYELVSVFFELTGVPLIINTSLNIKGEPIVCTPKEAIKTYLESEIDALVIGRYLVKKASR